MKGYNNWICQRCGEVYMDKVDEIPHDEICDICKQELESQEESTYQYVTDGKPG